MRLEGEPLLTTEISRDRLDLQEGTVYIHSRGIEDRSAIERDWLRQQEERGIRFVDVVGQEPEQIVVTSTNFGYQERFVNLRSATELMSLASDFGSDVVLDITGLSYGPWAALLRTFLGQTKRLRVVYVEPDQYSKRLGPTPGAIYDLSEKIEGLASLPGFTSLRAPTRPDRVCLIALLGFEGVRFEHILQQVEPEDDNVVPIVGLPGFRPEYPFVALLSNQYALSELTTSHNRIRYVKANCPFDLFHEITQIAEDYPGKFLRVAPIGTKPHGLGAVLFALSRPGSVEVLYDHPVRKEKRTEGWARLCCYDVGTFAESHLFNRYRSGD